MIVPTVHGTSLGVAWKICATGFAALSILVDEFLSLESNAILGRWIFWKGNLFYDLCSLCTPIFLVITQFGTPNFSLGRKRNQRSSCLLCFLEMYFPLLKRVLDLIAALGMLQHT